MAMTGGILLKLDAPNGSVAESAISNHDYPESSSGRTGPGWSWMWVPFPFNSQFVQARFDSRVYRRYQTAHTDLRAFIGENLVGNDERWSKAAVAALRDVTAQEFVLVCSHVWAFASFEVRAGGSAEAGTAFYNGWVGAVNADPRASYALMTSGKPTLMVWG